MKKILLLVGIILFPVSLYAQPGPITTGPQGSQPVRCVNAAGTAFESCAGGSGTTDNDDGTIASSQTGLALGIQLPYYYDGANWSRWDRSIVFGSPQAVTQSGTWTVQPGNTANTTPWLIKFSQTTTDNDVDATITNASIAVTGTFWQATQPVSGTFWQAVQPVIAAISQTGTDNDVDASILGVVTVTDGAGALNTIVDSGTLTVGGGTLTEVTTITNAVTVTDGAGALNVIVDSGTTTVTQATGTNLHVVVDTAPTTAVTGTFFQITQPISIEQTGNNNAVDVLTLPALVTGSAIVGRVGIDQTTPGTTNLVQITDGTGAVNVICDSGCGGAATFVDGGAGFTQESSSVNAPSGFIFDDTVGTALTENDIAAARVTAARAQVQRIEGNTRGTYATLTSTSLDVNCTGGCSAPATTNNLTISSFESVAAPTIATWYVKRQWALPASAVFTPIRAWSTVTTASSRTMIGVINNLGNINVSSNVFTDGNSVASPRHYARMFGCVTTVMSATANTITVTYIDELGNSQATAALSIPASAPVGNCFEFPLISPGGPLLDSGVRDITNITDSAAPTGVLTVYGINPIHDVQGAAITLEGSAADYGQLSSTEQIIILLQQAATTAQLRSAGITGSIR